MVVKVPNGREPAQVDLALQNSEYRHLPYGLSSFSYGYAAARLCYSECQ